MVLINTGKAYNQYGKCPPLRVGCLFLNWKRNLGSVTPLRLLSTIGCQIHDLRSWFQGQSWLSVNLCATYYPERWITWFVGRWRTQLIARQLVNCRTHEHRHFERTLRSWDTIPGPLLTEGRANNQDCLMSDTLPYITCEIVIMFVDGPYMQSNTTSLH